MNKLFNVFLWMFILLSPLHADIYKWTDNDGVVHFSDKPHSGATKMNLPQVQQYKPNDKSVVSDEDTPKAHHNEDSPYTSVQISQPKSEETIRNNQGFVPVVIDIQPELNPGDLLQIIFDGAPLGKPQDSKLFTLNNVNRGSHTIAAQVVDSNGNVLETTPEIAFFMQRPRVGMVPETKPIKPIQPAS